MGGGAVAGPLAQYGIDASVNSITPHHAAGTAKARSCCGTLNLTLPLARPGPELLRHDLRAPAALTAAAAIHCLEAPGDAFSALAVPEEVRARSGREHALDAPPHYGAALDCDPSPGC